MSAFDPNSAEYYPSLGKIIIRESECTCNQSDYGSIKLKLARLEQQIKGMVPTTITGVAGLPDYPNIQYGVVADPSSSTAGGAILTRILSYATKADGYIYANVDARILNTDGYVLWTIEVAGVVVFQSLISGPVGATEFTYGQLVPVTSGQSVRLVINYQNAAISRTQLSFVPLL